MHGGGKELVLLQGHVAVIFFFALVAVERAGKELERTGDRTGSSP